MALAQNVVKTGIPIICYYLLPILLIIPQKGRPSNCLMLMINSVAVCACPVSSYLILAASLTIAIMFGATS